MSLQKQKTSAIKPHFQFLKLALVLSIAVSGSLFFCTLSPAIWKIPHWGIGLCILLIAALLTWPVYKLTWHFIDHFPKTKPEYLNIALLFIISAATASGILLKSFQQYYYLPDVPLTITLQSSTSPISTDLPDIMVGSQRISISDLNSSNSCEIENETLQFTGTQNCTLSYAIPISRINNLEITLPHSETQLSAHISLRHINTEVDLSQLDAPQYHQTESINASFSPKKIRYPLNAACIFFCTAIIFLSLYRLGNTLLYVQVNQIFQKNSIIGKGFVSTIFLLIAIIYTGNRLVPSPWHFIGLYSDAANIASFAAANAHPDFFINDAFLSNPANYQGYFVFHVPLIQILGNLFDNYASAFTVLLFPTILLQLFGYYFLGKQLFQNRLLAFILSIITVFNVAIPYFSNEFFGLYGDVVPRVLFQAVLPYALIFLARHISEPRKWWLCSLIFVALFYIHPVSGPNWLIALFLSYILIMLVQFRRILWKPFFISLFISISGMIPFVQAFFVPSAQEPLNMELIKEIYAYRLASQTSSITHLFNYFIKMQITPYTSEIFLWGSSLLVLIALLVLMSKNLLTKTKLQPQNQNLIIGMLLFAWWIATLFSTLGIPLIDEAYTNATGNLPVLREIRRNIRYLLPLVWITFFWLTHTISQWTRNLKNNPIPYILQTNVILFSVFISASYFYQVKPFTDPVVQQSINCIKQGRLICADAGDITQKMDFYDHVCNIVQPDQAIFPDPSPAYLGDTLIPRYYCQRSVAYSYKDGASTGNSSKAFIENWWHITQEIAPLLPTNEVPLNLDILQSAQSTNADYFILINPTPQNFLELNEEQIIYKNNYAVLYQLSQ
jgi:hypothetical protein